MANLWLQLPLHHWLDQPFFLWSEGQGQHWTTEDISSLCTNQNKIHSYFFGSDVWNLLHPFPQKIALKLKSIDSCKFKISYIAEKAKENFWTLDNMYKSIAL